MEKISVGRGMLTDGAVWLGDEGGMARLRVPVTGGGLDVTWLKERDERYLVFSLEAEAEHSVPVNLLVYSSREESGEPVFGIRFGVLPQILTGICMDLTWLDAHALFRKPVRGS